MAREVGDKVWKLPLKQPVGKPRGTYVSSIQPETARQVP